MCQISSNVQAHDNPNEIAHLGIKASQLHSYSISTKCTNLPLSVFMATNTVDAAKAFFFFAGDTKFKNVCVPPRGMVWTTT